MNFKKVGSVSIYEVTTEESRIFKLNPLLNRPVNADDNDFQELKNSVKLKEQLEPIVISKKIDSDGKESFEVADGQHRLLALRELQKNVKFMFLDEYMPGCTTSDLINAKSCQRAYNSKAFVGSGVARGLRIFKDIEILKNSMPKTISFSIVLETVLSFIVNGKQSIYTNTRFKKSCRLDLVKTLEDIGQIPYTQKTMAEIKTYLYIMNEICLASGYRKGGIGIDYNRAFLSLRLGLLGYKFTIQDVRDFILSGTTPALLFASELSKAVGGNDVRKILMSYDKEIKQFKNMSLDDPNQMPHLED